MLNQKLSLLTVSLALLAIPAGFAGDSASDALKASGILERLTKQTGVYNASKTGKTPGFFVDPTWPQPLPHSWLLGQIGGLYVDQHDNIWVYQRPRTLLNDEAGLEAALPGVKDQKGQPINGLGQPRVYGAMEDCCKAAPSVLEFDPNGKLLRAWGGPADPGFIGGKCKEEAGCIWPKSEHGLYVDQEDNVWITGNGSAAAGGRAAAPQDSPWATNRMEVTDSF